MSTPAWLQRWQQQPDDELEYRPVDLVTHPADWSWPEAFRAPPMDADEAETWEDDA